MKPSTLNMHPADIMAAIAKKGSNLSRIARAHKISHAATSVALRKPCYVGEQAVANFLETPAHVIWPNRYDSNGIPLHPRIRKQFNVDTSIKASQKCAAV